MPRTEQLAAVLDTAAARPLAEMLRERLAEKEALLLDGEAVIQLGQACLQVMLSAQQSASERGRTLAVSRPSEAMRAMTTLAGCAGLLAATEN